MTYFFDTHCHFDSLDDARQQLPRAYEQGLRGINVIGTDLETSKLAIEVVRLINDEGKALNIEELNAMATVGLHPHEAKYYETQHNEIAKLLDVHRDLICGIGETGYDFYYNHSSQEEQTKAFIWQIELAKQNDLAMVIHTRDAWDETFALLDEQGWPSKCVLHCFTGTVVEATRAVESGAYISISGISTFKKAQDIRDAIAVVPLDRLVSETDAPWLAPEPHRGKPNEPAYASLVVDKVTQIRTSELEESEEQVRTALFENAMRLFR